MNTQIEDKLIEANNLREKEQYGESVKLFTESLHALVPDGDSSQLIHCLSGQSLVYKILIRENNHSIYRHLTLAFAKEAYEVAKINQDKLTNNAYSTACMSFADALHMDGQTATALPFFEEALATSTADKPTNGRIKSHIGEVKYFLGEKEAGISLINESLADIRTGDLSSYPIRVWETGALNSLAKIHAREGNWEEAQKTAQESLQISTDHNLSIRKREAEDILAQISSGKTDFSL